MPKQNRKKIRSARPWTTTRKVLQTVSLLTFLAFFVVAPQSNWPGTLTNSFLRVDPLIAFTNLLASRALVAGLALSLVTLALTLVFGKVWCGWFCPLGTLLDLFSFNRWKRKRVPPENWRKVKYGTLLVILFAALIGNLTLLVLDPLTILLRTSAESIWPGLDRLVIFIETSLYRYPELRDGVSSFDQLIRPSLLPLTPEDLRGAVIFGAIFTLIVLLNLFAERFWCRYLCPLGGLLGLVSKAAIIRRRVNSECNECGLCVRDCPTGTIQPDRAYASDPAECTMCLECLESCPKDATQFTVHLKLADFQRYDPDRRQVLLTFGLAIVGVGLLRRGQSANRHSPFLIRPPGTEEVSLLSTCVRCGQCVRVCPTGGLHPALTRAGMEGVWTPILIPRLGYCDYSCNACGESCPVDAIPTLSLELKRVQVIGQARIDQDRCIAWAEEQDCIVCEEMCPLPEKAIVLEEVEVHQVTGDTFTVQRPEVLVERCIGCGICEYKCPVDGEAAIQVYIPEEL
ncbi:MAG TPA: 4Fe-4S binding protein [Anaerolineae bacterium]|nr:4Fe-4S binding protein [Anaerolineae bacterium]